MGVRSTMLLIRATKERSVWDMGDVLSGPATLNRSEKRRLQVVALAGTLPESQIAKAVGITVRQVRRHKRAARVALKPLEAQLAEYRSLLVTELPLRYRAKRLRELADQSSQAMVALKAVEAADRLCGLSDAAREQSDPRPQPMFQLPAGCQVSVTVPRIVDVQAQSEVK